MWAGRMRPAPGGCMHPPAGACMHAPGYEFQDAVLCERPHTWQVEGGSISEREDLLAAARDPRGQLAGGLVGQPLDDQPLQRERLRTKLRDPDLATRAQHIV